MILGFGEGWLEFFYALQLYFLSHIALFRFEMLFKLLLLTRTVELSIFVDLLDNLDELLTHL